MSTIRPDEPTRFDFFDVPIRSFDARDDISILLVLFETDNLCVQFDGTTETSEDIADDGFVDVLTQTYSVDLKQNKVNPAVSPRDG